MVAVAVVLIGLVIGSFLNVVIARVPERRSLVHPRSSCPGCGTMIAWYDNIPILSFLALRGRCRTCAMPIPWRYPLVEAVTAALFLAAYGAFGPTPDAVVAAVLLASLVVITAIDLQCQIIPDVISLPGILAGCLANVATGRVPWVDSLLGIVVGGGVFLVIILASGGGMSLDVTSGPKGLEVATTKLTGIVRGAGTTLALVETQDGIGYILKPGDTLGDGRLVEIGADSAIFAVAAKPGAPNTNRVVLKLAAN